MNHLKFKLGAASGLLAASCAFGAYQRVLDFEDYTLTDDESVIQAEGWIFQDFDFFGYQSCTDGTRDCTGYREIVEAPFGGNGKAILIRATDPDEIDAANARSVSAFDLGTEIPEGSTATFYMRFAGEGRGVSAHFGLTPITAPSNDNADTTPHQYGDLATHAQVSWVSRETLGVYVGGWQDATLDETKVIVPETWYELWYHIHNEPASVGGGYFDLYIRGGVWEEITHLENPHLTDELKEQGFTDYGFRNTGGGALSRFINMMNGANPSEARWQDGVYFDDFYLDLERLTTETPELRNGNVVEPPELTSLWADDEGRYEDSGWVMSSIGLIYDGFYPWVYHNSTESYYYVLDAGSVLESFYLYGYEEASWLWSSSLYGGWYYNLEDQSVGTGGWLLWD